MCSGEHKCLICGIVYACNIEGKNGSMSSENCMGDYEDFCDNHTIDEIHDKCKDLNLI